ncbi:hypothetical protein DXG01_011013 [Tephrocybe rancida]|nr:hypothetical protein DXG01_011013 [Tephrocybe rancida]
MPDPYRTGKSEKLEIVDDSEPEREEIRQRQKCRLGKIAPTKIMRAPMIVAEISKDESTDAFSPAASPPKENPLFSNVEFDDDAFLPATHDAMSCKNEDIEPTISLARFAFNAPPLNRSRVSHELQNNSSTRGTNKRPVKRSTHRFAEFFSDYELGRVMKCVSCDMRWTVQKTVSQKMIHIQSCAMKKALSDETIRVLLRKEIDSCVEDAAPHKGKGKGQKLRRTTTGPETFVQRVLAGATPRNMAHHLIVQETVKPVSQTRHLILDRARAVMGSTSISDHTIDREPTSHTEDIGVLDLGSAALSPTQAFGHSALVQARRTTIGQFSILLKRQE